MKAKKVKGLCSSQHIKGYESRLQLSEKKDCVVRSIASAFDIKYDEAHEICKTEFGRKNKQGTMGTAWTFKGLSKKDFRIGEKPFTMVAKSVLTKKEGIKTLPITVNEFVEKYKTGSYIVLVSRHAFAIVNGVVIGNPDDADKLRCRVEDAVRVLSKNTPAFVQQYED